MGRKLADTFAYPPRALRADRAAAYLDMGTSTFLELVAQGRYERNRVGKLRAEKVRYLALRF